MVENPEPGPGSTQTAFTQDAGWADTARRLDPDRFLTALFAPADRRDALFALIAFNHELVRAVEMPTARSGAGPIAALIRLQWWREVVENSRADWHGHAVASAVRGLIDRSAVAMETLLALVASRETEAEGVQSVEEWQSMMLSGPGALQRAVAEALGATSAEGEAFAAIGAAYATGALRRHLAAVLAAGRCPLPDDLLHEAGTSREALAEDPGAEALAMLDAALVREGRRFMTLAGVSRFAKTQRAAALPLVLAGRDLSDRPGRGSGARGLGDRAAVLRAAIFGLRQA